MKHVSMFLILLVSVLLIGCASQEYRLKADEEIYGTWENVDYIAGGMASVDLVGAEKVIFYPGGKCHVFHVTTGTIPVVEVDYTTASKEIDSDGSVVYKQSRVHFFEHDGKRFEKGRNYVAIKVSPSKQTLEIVFDADDYPVEVDTGHHKYRIFYRQE